MLNQQHGSVLLEGPECTRRTAGNLYMEERRPGILIGLMLGLHYLKHTCNLMDKEVTA
jgi:hypothetical protein